MAYVDEYQGFVPIVSGFRPSTRNTNTASTYAPVSTGFVPVVGGFPRTQYRAPTPQPNFSSFDGEQYTSPSSDTPQYDFSAFRGPSSTSTPEQQQTTATTSSSVISDLESYAHDDPPSDLDEIGFTDEELSGPDFTGPGVSGFDSFAEALGFTSGNPTGYEFTEADVLGQGLKGEVVDTFSSPENFATTVAKSIGTNMLTSFGQAALGKIGLGAVPLGALVAIGQGIFGGFSTQNALQGVVDQHSAMWGGPPEEEKSIGFWNSLGAYLGLVEPHTLMTEEEFDFMLDSKYGAYNAGNPLHGTPRTLYEPNQKSIKQIEEEIAHHQAIVEEIAAIEKGIQYEIEALNLVHDVVSDTDTGGVDPFGAEEVAAAPASGAEGELGVGTQGVDPFGGIGDPPSDDGGGGGGGGPDGGEGEGDPSSGDCWVAGTQILMEDGSCKNIENLKIGDKVMSFPENTELRRWNTPLEVKPIISLVVGTVDVWHLNDSMVSGAEWMIKGDGTAAIVKWLNVGDTVMDKDGNPVEIYKVEPAQGELKRQVIYNFETEDNYSYIANGMRTIRGRAVPSKGYTKRLSDGDTNIYKGSMQDEYKRKFGS